MSEYIYIYIRINTYIYIYIFMYIYIYLCVNLYLVCVCVAKTTNSQLKLMRCNFEPISRQQKNEKLVRIYHVPWLISWSGFYFSIHQYINCV